MSQSNRKALLKAGIAVAVYAIFCVVITSYPRFELFRVIIWVMEFPAFFVSTIFGGNIHDFNPTPVYVIYGVILFTIVFSAVKVQSEQKGATTAT